MNKETFSKLDYTLIFIVFLLFCISLLAIHNAPLTGNVQHVNFVVRQAGWYMICSIVAFLVLLVDYDHFKQVHWYLYGFGMFLLLGLTAAQFHVPVPFTNNDNGAWSWYTFPGIGQIQPAEFMKLFLIFSLGATIEKHNEMYPVRGVHEDLLLLGKIALISLPPLGLIFIQPDLGTALVMFSIIVAVTLVSGIRWQFVATMFSAIALGLAVFFISWFKFPWLVDIVLKSHQKERFLAWFEPYKYTNSYGYQLINALNSIGSGQVFSKALDKSISFPEAYNDFIFAVIGGSFGFIGAATVITLFFLMIYRIVHAAIETHDPFGSYVCTGIIGMFMFQVFENIGMTIQVMPVTGITLPFISYGGSSLLTSMISIGLVLSIQSRTRKYMFT